MDLNFPDFEQQAVGRLIEYGSEPAGEKDREEMFDAIEKLKPEMFRSEFNGSLFCIIRTLARGQDRLPSLLEIVHAARRDPALKQIGDIDARIGELVTAGAETTDTFTIAVGKIAEIALQNNLMIEIERSAGKLKESDPGTAGAIVDELQSRLDAIRDGDSAEYHGTQIGQIGWNLLEAIDKGDYDRRIPTGFPALDKLLNGGFRSQTLNVIAARPSVGKSSLMIQMATEAARDGHNVLILSLEMSEEQIGEWIYRQTYGEPILKDRGPERFKEYIDLLTGLPIIVYDRPADIARIESVVKRWKRKGKTDIVYIDYVGKIRATDEQAKQTVIDRLDDISSRLKDLAKRLKLPIVLLAQLNRESAKGTETSPRMDQLRGSGGLEQNADDVLLLWRPDPGDRERVVIIVDKQRDGIAGITFELGFDGSATRFNEVGDQTGTGPAANPYGFMNSGGFDD